MCVFDSEYPDRPPPPFNLTTALQHPNLSGPSLHQFVFALSFLVSRPRFRLVDDQISTSRMHDLSDSDSSMSLTGNFGSPITFASTSATATAVLSAAPAVATAENAWGTARVVATEEK